MLKFNVQPRLATVALTLWSIALVGLLADSASTPDEHKSCSTDDLPNVEFDDLTNITAQQGEQVRVYCKNGYRFPYNIADRSLIATCTDGQWMVGYTDYFFTVPSCERASVCTAPDIPHGRVTNKPGGYFRQELTPVLCDAGYSVEPPDSTHLLCHSDGTWRNKIGGLALPRCTVTASTPYQERSCSTDDLPNVSFDDLTNGTSQQGAQVRVYCKDGYRFPHTTAQNLIATCTDGQWMVALNYYHFKVRSCERAIGCRLPDIANGRLPVKSDGYLSRESAPILCHIGFSLEPPGSTHLVCHSDGSWRNQFGEHKLPSCIAKLGKKCELPMIPAHMTTKGASDTDYRGLTHVAHGTKLFYHCDEGYKVKDEKSLYITCRNGQWSDELPSCVKKYADGHCGKPRSLQGGSHSILYHGSFYISGASAFSEGAEVHYVCDTGYKLLGSSTRKCMKGQWSGSSPSCVPLSRGCSRPSLIKHGHYNYQASSERSSLAIVPEYSRAFYYCNTGFQMQHPKTQFFMQCVNGVWTGELPVCVKRGSQCEEPMEIDNGRWIYDTDTVYPDYRVGNRILYECNTNYKLVGPVQIRCLETGYWSDNAPRCLPKEEYCNQPEEVENGMFLCKPYTCNLFQVGTQIHYMCDNDYEARESDILVQTCQPGGHWSATKPVCLPVMTTLSPFSATLTNSNTLVVVIATSCSVLGLLVAVMTAVIIQKRRLAKAATRRMSVPSLDSDQQEPPPYAVQPNSSLDEHDRVALIAFADGVQVVLPSYEEATRGHHPPRLSRFNSDSSHSSSGRSLRGEYRPLPSLPSTLRSSGTQRDAPSDGHRDHHRNSIITTTSTTTRDNLSLVFGSIDTMNVSDGTSTSVTIGTYDSAGSNPSIATSQRATAGSLDSANGTLAKEDVPLLDSSSGDSSRNQSCRSQPDAASIAASIAEEPKQD